MRITTDSGMPAFRARVTKLRRRSWNQAHAGVERQQEDARFSSSTSRSSMAGLGGPPRRVFSVDHPTRYSSTCRTVSALART